MPSFIKEAHTFIDRNGDCNIELKYSRYVSGLGYCNSTTCFKAEAIGGWQDFVSKKESIPYEEFLDDKIEKTIDVIREMTLIALDNVMCENNNIYCILRIMNTSKILDPTFIPPYINVKHAWQRKFARCVCETTIPYIIKYCRSTLKLIKLYNVLKLIEESIE
jgi:hypothetical protein